MEKDNSDKSIYANWEADKATEDDDRALPGETREARAEHGLRMMERINLGETFSSEESIRKFIEETNYDEFMRLLVYANGNLRGIPPKGREIEPQRIASVGGDIPPRKEDKPKLMEETLAAMKRMNESGRPLEEIAEMACLCSNTIHYFGNANGRISRAAYFLFRNPHPDLEGERPVLKTLLTERKGTNLFEINSYSYGRYINDAIYRQDLELDDRDPLSPSGFNEGYFDLPGLALKLKQKKNDMDIDDLKIADELICSREGLWGRHGFLAFAKFLKDKGELEKYKVVHTDSAGNPGTSSIRSVDVLADLSKEDVKKIWDIYWSIKKQFVTIMIDSIENPERYVYDKTAEKPEYISDFLKSEFKHSSQWLDDSIEKLKQDPSHKIDAGEVEIIEDTDDPVVEPQKQNEL